MKKLSRKISHMNLVFLYLFFFSIGGYSLICWAYTADEQLKSMNEANNDSFDSVLPAEKNEDSIIPRDQYNFDFDARYAYQYVDYTWIVEDPINVGLFYINILKLLDKGEFDQAEKIVSSKIDDYLNSFTPEGTDISQNQLNDDSAFATIPNLQPMLESTVYDGVYCKLVQLRALILELQGKYEDALLSYRIVFGANKKMMRWTDARLFYECDDHELAFQQVCDIIQTFYDLSPEDVDVVVEKVKETELKRKSGANIDTYHKGVEIELDEKRLPDFKALELYRIRELCGRFVCPNQVYKHFMYAWDEDAERAEAVQLIRDNYAQFMEFMEEEYHKACEPVTKSSYPLVLSKRNPYYKNELRPPTDNAKAPQYMKFRFRDTIELLRKIKELPY